MMVHIKKYSSTLLSAFIVTYALMLIMSTLIDSGEEVIIDESVPLGDLVFIRVPEPEKHVITKVPPKPVPVLKPPPFEAARDPITHNGSGEGHFIRPVITPVIDGDGALQASGQLLLRFAIAPDYPPRAAEKGIEGYAIIEFTVAATGAVVDPVVLDAQPGGYFESSALKAIKRFKYQPQLDGNGNPVEKKGMQYQFIFELDQK